MKSFIPTTLYAVLNYVLALTLIASPWLFGFEGHKVGAALLLPMIIGWFQLIMAIFSNNSLGFIKQFPMQMHFFLDVLSGSFLLCSPFIYGYAHIEFVPQLILGGLLVIMGAFTHGSRFTTPAVHHRDAGLASVIE
ncbi:SPW repeat domain-containing protein [Mucilaginibacter sp. SP1R1]|uniref:SPW repeat domain-containing protein n=1 Tax=Mucilaginibacter sp. SP1R1 TaxID=2723091 RepID=UPI001611F491|nr:hypothetical protein [Mucilaginibacter sp. SP1R1]MBB6152335.1 hypothetical protein [Mucilaginibacter sp. SP1R1]